MRMHIDGIKNMIKDVPDFPRPGVTFKDIGPLLRDPLAFDKTLSYLLRPWYDQQVQRVVGIESRGFVFAAPVANCLGAGFEMVRKPKKLPGELHTTTYDLEYGSDGLALQRGVFQQGERVVIVDDILATGGTASAAHRLVTEAGGVVLGFSFVIELTDLGGRRKLEELLGAGHIDAMIQF